MGNDTSPENLHSGINQRIRVVRVIFIFLFGSFLDRLCGFFLRGMRFRCRNGGCGRRWCRQRSQFFLHGFGNGEILTDRNSNRGSNILGKSGFAEGRLQDCPSPDGQKDEKKWRLLRHHNRKKRCWLESPLEEGIWRTFVPTPFSSLLP